MRRLKLQSWMSFLASAACLSRAYVLHFFVLVELGVPRRHQLLDLFVVLPGQLQSESHHLGQRLDALPVVAREVVDVRLEELDRLHQRGGRAQARGLQVLQVLAQGEALDLDRVLEVLFCGLPVVAALGEQVAQFEVFFGDLLEVVRYFEGQDFDSAEQRLLLGGLEVHS